MHHKSKISFDIVEKARDAREFDGITRIGIIELLWNTYMVEVSINTLDDWLYYRTRISG